MAIGITFFYFSNIVLSLIIFVLLSFKIIRTPEDLTKLSPRDRFLVFYLTVLM